MAYLLTRVFRIDVLEEKDDSLTGEQRKLLARERQHFPQILRADPKGTE